MSKLVAFPTHKVKECDYCGTMGGEEIQGIGINKIVPNPLGDKLGHWVKEVCSDCLGCMSDYDMEED